MNEDHTELLKLALERFDEAETNDQDNRRAALDDLRFLTGDHWYEADKQNRLEDGRPTLTINRMPQFVRQVTGDIRRTNPAIAIGAADDKATEEKAEIIEGLVRNIEQLSDASSIYERAAESAASCGLGHWRIRADYEDDTSFNQEILVEAIPNPFAVHWDSAAKDPTRKDARFCFVTERMPRDLFEETHPDAITAEWESGETDDSETNWNTDDTVTVAEYFWKEAADATLYQLIDGTVVDEKPEDDAIVQRKRKATAEKVMWAKMTSVEVIEGPTELPSKHIPVIAVVGEETNVADTVVRTSVIRYAKDAQRMYNYWRSAQTETIALQPKAPYLVTPSQIEGFEAYWEQANTANKAFLPFNPDPKHPGKPQRELPPVPSSGMTQEIMLAAEDMKATTGIYDAALGEGGNETSGVAIRQRQLEGDVSTSIYVDNLAKSIAQCGRVIVDMIPKIYDTTRAVRILGKDDSAKMVQVNVPMVDEQGFYTENDLAVGKYDVRISTGPNFSTQRQEAAESMTEFVRVFPQAAPIIGDLIAKNMDWPGSEEIAERLKKMLPPGIAEESEDEEVNPEVQLLQQQLQEMQQQLEGISQEPEFRKAQAEATEAEADAEKAQFEAELKRLELAGQNGQMNAAIDDAVARALTQPRQAPTLPFMGQ